jgi:hypothetical protein
MAAYGSLKLVSNTVHRSTGIHIVKLAKSSTHAQVAEERVRRRMIVSRPALRAAPATHQTVTSYTFCAGSLTGLSIDRGWPLDVVKADN